MFGSLGLPEILVILVLALLIFGPKRLPEVGRTIGKGLAEFRRATTDLKRSVNTELSLTDEERTATSRRPPIEGVGRTAAEASTTHELPPASEADAAEDGAEGEEATPAAESSATPASPATDTEVDAAPAAAGPPGTEPRSEVDDASDTDAEPPANDTSRATTNG